jgi:hypothetical protein
MLFILWITVLSIPSTVEIAGWDDALGSCMVVYYALLVLVIIIGATGFCVEIFTKYGVNYSYIFELDIGSSNIKHHQLYIIALEMLFIWFLCLNMQTFSFKFGWRMLNYPISN